MKKELNIKAIIIGYATMFGVGVLMAIALSVAVLLIPSHSFPSHEQLKDDLPPFLLVQSMIGRFSGGFVTGWIAKHDQVKNAFALAVLDLILIRAMTLFSESGPVLSVLVGIMTVLFATIFGGYLAKLVFERWGCERDNSV